MCLCVLKKERKGTRKKRKKKCRMFISARSSIFGFGADLGSHRYAAEPFVRASPTLLRFPQGEMRREREAARWKLSRRWLCKWSSEVRQKSRLVLMDGAGQVSVGDANDHT